MKKIFLICLIFFVVIAIGALIYIFVINNEEKIQTPIITKIIETDSTLTICAVGDIMLGSSYPSEAYLPKNGGKDLLKNVEAYFKSDNPAQAHIVFGNLEGVLFDGVGNRKKCDDESKCYNFKMPAKSISILKAEGFNLLSIANNHIGDFGLEAISEEIKTLKANSFYFAGAKSVPYSSFKIGSLKIGFTAFSPNTETNDLRDIDKALKIIKFLDSTNDIVIVSFHGGAEGAKNNHVRNETEFFLEENRGNVYQFAHRAIDAGADVILGHGPHVLRAMEIYKNRLIAYSLGNFATYRQINISGANGIACILQMKLSKSGELISGNVIPTKQIAPGTPIFDKNKAAIKTLNELSKYDFPNNLFSISEDGALRK